MKKLLLISDNYPFGKNESTFIMPELPALMEKFEVVIASCNCTDEQTAPVPDGIRVLRINMHQRRETITGRLKAVSDPAFYRECRRVIKSGSQVANRLKWSLSYYASGENFACELRRQLKKIDWQPDIIYCYWHMTPLWGVLMRKKWFGNPVVVARAHGRDIYNFRNPYGWQAFKPESDRRLDAMYLACRAAYDYYIEHFSVNPDKSRVSYLGSDGTGKASWKPDDSFRLFSCSNVIPLKRVGLIAEALALIDDIKISWTHAGAGDQLEAVSRFAEENLAAKPNISFKLCGQLPNSEVKNMLSEGSWDFFITATETEGGVPVSIVEAFAFGVPAIATAVGGIPEIVDSSTGFLMSENPDAEEVADTIRKACAMSEAEYLQMRDNAYARWCESFVAKDNAERFAGELYEMCRR